jgi:hypothetical protein
VRHAEPAAGQQFHVRQSAYDRVLYTAGLERVDQIPTVLELALEVFPVVSDAERAVAVAECGT